MAEPLCGPIRDIREELTESCGSRVRIFACCCNQEQAFEGVVSQVGIDFVELHVGTIPTIVVIPLNRVLAVRELLPVGENGPNCSVNLTFRNKIAEFCGKCLTVPWCSCNVVRVPTGVLGDLGEDFLELLNVNNSGEHLIISLPTVCSVQKCTG